MSTYAVPIYVNVRPTTKVNAIRVQAIYDGDASPKGLYLNFQPVFIEEGCLKILGITDPVYKSRNVLADIMSRRNRKTLAKFSDMVHESVQSRIGDSWLFVVAFAEERGLEILPLSERKELA